MYNLIKSALIGIALALSASAHETVLNYIQCVDHDPKLSSNGRYLTSLNFTLQNSEQEEIGEIEVNDDDGFLTLACVNRILQSFSEKMYSDAKSQDSNMTRKQFFRDLSEKTLTKFANEKSEKTVNILTLCYKLAELALSRLEDRLFTHNNGYEYDYIKDREKLPQLISKFKSISLNDFTWNSFSKLFAGWMGKNKTCTVYDYNFTPNDAYSSEEFSLPETVNLKNLGLKGAALFSSEEDHLRPQANATLLINFESILQSLKYLPKK